MTVFLSSGATSSKGSLALGVALISLCWATSSSVLAQTYNSTESENTKTVRLTDDTGHSPDRIWDYRIDNSLRPIVIDGPRTDVEDVISVSWSADGLTKTVTNSLGHQLQFQYDSLHRLLRMTDANGQISKLLYDDETGLLTGYIVEALSASPRHTQFTYNDQGRIIEVMLPTGAIVPVITDEKGEYDSRLKQILSEVDSIRFGDHLGSFLGNIQGDGGRNYLNALIREGSELVYDESGQIISSVDSLGNKSEFTYDNRGNPSSIRDARGIVTSFTYNGLGDLVRETSPEVGTIRYDYDSAGNLIREIRQGNLVIKRSYDALNRLKREVFREAGVDRKVLRYEYDGCENGVGRLCRVRGESTDTRFDYTPDGSFSRVADHHSDGSVETTRYIYDNNRNLKRLRYPSGLVVRFGYDAQGFVSKITGKYETDEEPKRFIIAQNVKIDPHTRLLEKLTFGNGITTKYDFADDVLQSIVLRKDGQRLDRLIYKRNGDGNVVSIDRLDETKSTKFEYDSVGRLVQESQ